MSVLIPDQDHSANEESGRSWPLPKRSHTMRMKWHDLLFLHWPLSPDIVAKHLPEELQVETFDSTAWIGVVPFWMSGVTPRWVPGLPWISSFPELNVRTYVTCEGKPGIWFFTLDATNPVAVRVARMWFYLNYVDARIKIDLQDNWIRYRSDRTDPKQMPAELRVDYRPIGDVFFAKPGTLEHWLTSRYCLYTSNRTGGLFRAEIDHAPWKLRNAQAVIHQNTMLDFLGASFENQQPLVHFAKRTDALAWTLDSV